MKFLFANCLDVMLDNWNEASVKREPKGEGGGRFASGGGSTFEETKERLLEPYKQQRQMEPLWIPANELIPHIRAEAKRAGFTGKVNIRKTQGKKFKVAGQSFRTGANYNSDGNVINMWIGSGANRTATLGLLNHEIQHDRFYQVIKSPFHLIKNRQDLTEEGKRKEDVASAFRAKWNWWDGTPDHEEIKRKLIRDDGVTNYSTEYWNQFKKSGHSWDLSNAVNETLAEIANRDHMRAVGREHVFNEIMPIWRDLYDAMQTAHAEMNPPKPPKEQPESKTAGTGTGAGHKAWLTRQANKAKRIETPIEPRVEAKPTSKLTGAHKAWETRRAKRLAEQLAQ